MPYDLMYTEQIVSTCISGFPRSQYSLDIHTYYKWFTLVHFIAAHRYMYKYIRECTKQIALKTNYVMYAFNTFSTCLLRCKMNSFSPFTFFLSSTLSLAFYKTYDSVFFFESSLIEIDENSWRCNPKYASVSTYIPIDIHLILGFYWNSQRFHYIIKHR